MPSDLRRLRPVILPLGPEIYQLMSYSSFAGDDESADAEVYRVQAHAHGHNQHYASSNGDFVEAFNRLPRPPSALRQSGSRSAMGAPSRPESCTHLLFVLPVFDACESRQYGHLCIFLIPFVYVALNVLPLGISSAASRMRPVIGFPNTSQPARSHTPTATDTEYFNQRLSGTHKKRPGTSSTPSLGVGGAGSVGASTQGAQTHKKEKMNAILPPGAEVDVLRMHQDLMAAKKNLLRVEDEKNGAYRYLAGTSCRKQMLVVSHFAFLSWHARIVPVMYNKMVRLEAAMRKRDREFDEVLIKGAQAANGESCAGSFLYIKSERNLLDSLRRRATDLERLCAERDAELAALRQSVKFARANETQVLAQTYLTEARRMRVLLLQSQEQLQQQIASCQTNHAGNFQLLQARATALQIENARLSAQLSNAVDTAESLMTRNQSVQAEADASAARLRDAEELTIALQRKIVDQQQQLLIARNAAATAAAAAQAAADVAQEQAIQYALQQQQQQKQQQPQQQQQQQAPQQESEHPRHQPKHEPEQHQSKQHHDDAEEEFHVQIQPHIAQIEQPQHLPSFSEATELRSHLQSPTSATSVATSVSFPTKPGSAIARAQPKSPGGDGGYKRGVNIAPFAIAPYRTVITLTPRISLPRTLFPLS